MLTAVTPRPRSAPLALLLESVTVAGRRLRRLRRAPGRLIGIVMNPLISMIVLGYLFQGSLSFSGRGSYQEYIFAGAAAQVGLAGIGPTAVAVAADLRGGLVDRFRSMPISRPAVLVGHTLGDLVVGLIGLAVVTAAGLAFGWRPHSGVLPFLAGLALLTAFMYAMLWVGLMLGMFSRTMETINVVAGLVTVLLTFLSNAFQSVDRLPGWLRLVAEWNPVSAVVTALRRLWGNPDAAGSAATPSLSLTIAASLGTVFVVTVLLSLRRYRSAVS
ncbi:ABC transporter permease [Kitasatospora xanthocidica]|uniref:Transport permease protein n=1 Tax=Kitasatospora xanthocidica TaxID=83382 RepID=A0A372ZSX1_9ACTN|nr:MULTISPECIES: ABC transporter permease [Streptomycetaceae]OKI07689.1 ABC transporter [Streptomyces sp. CB02056]RGD58552.1 ABC transporter permease [Kitasatospora xanthocidica]